MSGKRVLASAALLLVALSLIIVGASQSTQVRIPPGPIVESPNARANSGTEGARPAVPDAPALQPASKSVAFMDDFSGGNLDRWRTIDADGNAQWVVQQGRLLQYGTRGEMISDQPTTLVIKDLTFTDGTLEAQVYSTSGSPVGLVFRGSDAGYYRLTLFAARPNDAPKAVLEAVSPQGAHQIAATPAADWAGVEQSRWHTIAVSTAGEQITVSVDGVQLMSANDSTFGAGWAGVWTVADMGAQFDNVRVQAGAR